MITLPSLAVAVLTVLYAVKGYSEVE